jgi:hypothetical protein
MIAAANINLAGFELLLLAGADPLSRKPSGMNLLHIVALHPKSAPCVTLLIRYRDQVVCELIDSADTDGNTPLHIAAMMDNAEFVWAILQTGKLPMMIPNGKRQTPPDLANEEIRNLLTGRVTVKPIETSPMIIPEYSANNEIQHLLDVLAGFGLDVPANFRPENSRLLASLLRCFDWPPNTEQYPKDLMNRLVARWSLPQGALLHRCVLYLHSFMNGASLPRALGFLEFIADSTFLPTMDMWIEAIVRSLTCAVNQPAFDNALTAARTFASQFGLSQFLPRPIIAEPMASFICRLMSWFPKLFVNAANIQLKWIRYLPIDHNRSEFGHLWDLSDSLAATLYKKAKPNVMMMDSALTVGNWILDSRQLSPSDRSTVLNVLIPFAQRKELPAIATLVEDICIAFQASFVKRLRIDEFQKPIEALSQFLDLVNSPKLANSIVDLRKSTRETKLREASQQARTSRFAEGRSVSALLAAFAPSSERPDPFAFEGKPTVALSESEREQLNSIANELNFADAMNRRELVEAGQGLGTDFSKIPSIETLGRMIAIVRQMMMHILKKRPFTMQCLAAAGLLLPILNPSSRKGRVAQVGTGEGKSIIISLVASVLALMGRYVDVITSTQYLASRDEKEFRPVYTALGISSSSIASDHPPPSAFAGRILYGTNTDFEFGYLRDQLKGGEGVSRQHPYDVAIVDESDNLFIDTAGNSARIGSGASSVLEWVYPVILDGVRKREPVNELFSRIDSIKKGAVSYEKCIRLIQSAQIALQKVKDVDYVLKSTTKGPIVEIIDRQITGRRSTGCRWTAGIHEFVEAIEGIEIQPKLCTSASISHPSFFRLYTSVFGLTGTCGEQEERDEISQIYNVDTFDVPPNRPCQRVRGEMLAVETQNEKYDLIARRIDETIRSSRPSLVIMSSIQETLIFSSLLKARGVTHQILNDVQTEDEDFLLRRAGYPEAVTIATNAAGRGTDIVLSGASEGAGGLHVIVAFFPINFRVECQAYGRAGRQGQRGSCEIICSFDETFITDDLQIWRRPSDLFDLYRRRSAWIAQESFRRLQSVKRDSVFFQLLQHYFGYLKELVGRLQGSERTMARIELVRAESIWSEFFGELDEDHRRIPDDAEGWTKLQFATFRQRVAQIMTHEKASHKDIS